MCGIAAIISECSDIPMAAIARMTERLQHRGPDAQNWVTLPACHLGHTRLSIIDLAGGAQPMTEETERYWLIFNGEIYNYQHLRRTLEQQGCRFRTQSDTEVLLQAYQVYGREVLKHLNGQFAFAIWDTTERRLFAARDRLGEKPLFWATSPQGHLLLASEIKSLLASDLIDPRLDPNAVDAYLALLYVPPNRTIYQNIYPLRPGHALSWQNGQLHQWSYWQPIYSQTPQATLADPQETIEKLRYLIAQAVQRQMVADVPIGAFLSGGLDSSTVVALMTQYGDQPPLTFSVGFGDLINELPYARTLARAYKTEHQEIEQSIPVGEILERLAEVYDEPFADSSNIPTYYMAEFARRKVKVVLTGDGGDEIFGGYRWYHWLLTSMQSRSMSRVICLKLIALVWQLLAKIGLPVAKQQESAAYIYGAARSQQLYPDLWERHLAFATGLKLDRDRLWDRQTTSETVAAIRQIYQPASTVKWLDRASDFDVRCYLAGDILVKVDRAAMAHGLETRSPFLDVDLVEFVLNLPWQFRFQDMNLKSLLRNSCRDLLPETIQQRSKQGFGAPIGHWIARPDVQTLWQRVSQPQSPLVALLPGIRQHQLSLTTQQIWTILCLGLWLEKRPECLNSLA